MSKALPNIILTNDELENIKANILNYLSGSEGVILKESDKKVKKILLSEVMEDMYKSPEEIEKIRKNKQNKVMRLGEIDSLKNELKVSATISDSDGKFIGYEMESPGPLYSLDTWPFETAEEKVYYLRQLKSKLEDFHQNGIVYGDIKESNILWNSDLGIICFCDLDNIQIDDYKIDLVNHSISEFVKENGYVSAGVDSYMFNLLTLQQLFYPKGDLYYMKERLKKIVIGENATIEFAKVLSKMRQTTNYYDGGYLIDYLKK